MRPTSAIFVVVLTSGLFLLAHGATTTTVAPTTDAPATTTGAVVVTTTAAGQDPTTAAPTNETTTTGIVVPNPPTLAVEASDFFATACDDHLNCTSLANTVCDTNADGNKFCRCDVDNFWKRDEDKCFLQQTLGGICQDGLSVCTDKNSICKYDGGNTPQRRCVCKNTGVDFIPVEQADGTIICAKILTRVDQPRCDTCADNEGYCYNLPAADGTFTTEKNGCRCPVSRSGSDCGTIHVDVNCDLDAFTMNICYTPHDDLNADEISMYVNGYGKVAGCVAKRLTNATAHCAAGSFELMLSMTDGERGICGTKSFSSGQHGRRIENTLVVEDSPMSVKWKLFKTYCSFTRYADVSSGSISVDGLNHNDRGEHFIAELDFYVMNALGQKILSGYSLRLNQKVKFKIDLISNGTYAALKPLMCLASSSGSIPDYNDETITLLVNGCPLVGGQIMTEANRFQPVFGHPDQVSTGFINMFKTKKSSSVFIHCTIQLCLKGSEADCLPENCTAPPNPRGKRASSAEERDIQIELEVYDPEAQEQLGKDSVTLTSTGFAVIISMVVAVVVISIIVASIFIYKIRIKPNKVGDNVEMSQKPPQRFALPRINRNHMRL